MLPLLPFLSSAVLHLSRNLSISRVSTYPHRAPYGPSNIPLLETTWRNDLQSDAASKNSFLTGWIFACMISWSTPVVENLMVTHLDKERHNFFQLHAHCRVHKTPPFDPYHNAVVSVFSITVYALRFNFHTGLHLRPGLRIRQPPSSYHEGLIIMIDI
jgi:hypothetical protein